jgi:LysM repeat protein
VGYWGWRPLIFALFISVWIVGCSITADTAPTASSTESPRITLTLRLPASATPITTPTFPASTLTNLPQTPETSLTPVVYVVESGDTLLGIALEYGVDLEVLRQANGNLDPRSLQIGQEIIIPTHSGTALAAPTTPTPLALSLDPPTCYEISTLSLLCLGQIVNTLDQPVERAAVAVQLLRADRTLLTEKWAITEQTIILPGQAAPYRMLFVGGWEGYAEAVAVLLSADSAEQDSERYISPIIENEESTVTDGHYVVTATLRNPGPQPAQSLRVIITLYDNRRRVVGYRAIRFDDPLPGDGTLLIEVNIVPQVDESSELSHILYAEAWRGS